MEKLEEIAKLPSVDLEETPLYEGLTLIEDRLYNGPTGIRYWM